MDLSRPAIALCVEGTQLEFQKQIEAARQRYAEAWACATRTITKSALPRITWGTWRKPRQRRCSGTKRPCGIYAEPHRGSAGRELLAFTVREPGTCLRADGSHYPGQPLLRPGSGTGAGS